MFRVPSELRAARPMMIDGQAVAANAKLTNGQISKIRHLSVWLTNGWITMDKDPHGRRSTNPQPTSLPPVIYNAMTAGFTAAVADGGAKKANVTITGGVPPFTVDYGEGVPSKISGRSSSHTYGTTGAKNVAVADSAGRSVSEPVTLA